MNGVIVEFGKETDPARKKELLEKGMQLIPKVAEKLESILEKNNKKGGNGFFVGTTPTVADFIGVKFFNAIDFVAPGSDMASKFKLLKAHRELLFVFTFEVTGEAAEHAK